jgi:hypothetical protein
MKQSIRISCGDSVPPKRSIKTRKDKDLIIGNYRAIGLDTPVKTSEDPLTSLRTLMLKNEDLLRLWNQLKGEKENANS